jgi:hypothetical protein
MERIYCQALRIDLDRTASSLIKTGQVESIDVPLGSDPSNKDLAVASRGDCRSREFYFVAFSGVREL